jgi:hypothetical protein
MGVLKRKWLRRCSTTPEPGPQRRKATVDELRIPAAGDPFTAGEADDSVEAHYASLERPHVCTDGVVFIGHLVEDPGTGEETEVIEAVPCRRCAEDR